MKSRIILGVASALLALTVAYMTFARTPWAVATQGQPVLAGLENSETFGTTICRLATGTCGGTNSALYVQTDLESGKAVQALANNGIGVQAFGKTTGVRGQAAANGTGVFGTHNGDTGIGVWGQTGGVGSAVYGEATEDGVGVFGDTVNGTGVIARSTNGNALDVRGRAAFSLSGIAVVQPNRAIVTVSNVSLTNSSLVLALIQGNVTGTWVRGVVLDIVGDKITIRLNKVVSNAAFVGWFVVN